MPAALHSAPPAAAGEAQNLVDKVELTVNAFQVEQDMGSMQSPIRRAHGVLIIPRVLKANFFIGGEGGTGVLMTRQLDSWSAPAFYTTGAGSIGLQFGVQTSEVVLVFMTDRTVDAVLFNKVKLNADGNTATGLICVGIEAGRTTELSRRRLRLFQIKKTICRRLA